VRQSVAQWLHLKIEVLRGGWRKSG